MKYLHYACWMLLLACQDAPATTAETINEQKKNAIGCMPTPTTDMSWYSSNQKAPMIPGLEGINFEITTNNTTTQAYFNQGMMLAYGFNHAEAARSFFEAIRQDSNSAMAHWGFAYVLGSNYNAAMSEEEEPRAYKAIQKALSLMNNVSSKEQSLIKALSLRYPANKIEDRATADNNYSSAMHSIYKQYPNDPDIAVLYAESVMNIHPWDLYEKNTYKPKEWTAAIVNLLEGLIQNFPKHPGVHHLYIHSMEASATPEKALASAKVLETLVPGAGHLVHMPSHIYINTGDYHAASISNMNAIEVDSLYVNACYAQGIYPLSYYPHNFHFLTATATLEGNSKLAWEASQKLQSVIAKDIMQEAGWGTLQHYYTIPYYVAVKLSLWDTLLNIPSPDPSLIYPNAVLHYAKGLAQIGKGNITASKKHLDSLKVLSNDSSLVSLTIWDINTTADLAKIAVHVLEAAIAYQEKNIPLAKSSLEKAVAIEDQLNYNEPPDWFFSVRHHLGALLMMNKEYANAQAVYEKDLKKWKKNGWSLIGLQQSLEKQNQKDQANKIKADFDEAWKYADFKITSSSNIIL